MNSYLTTRMMWIKHGTEQ